MRSPHPAAELFPLMGVAEYLAFVEDVRANGFREPAWIDKTGRILDGRNRTRAAKDTGRVLTYRTYEGDDPIAFVLSLNAHRRHMNASQLAAVAAEAVAMYEAEATKRMKAGKKSDPEADRPQGSPEEQKSTTKAAKAVGASARSTKKAKRVLDADPELHQQVKAGTVKVDAAEKQVAWQQAVEQFPFLDGIPKKLHPEFLGAVKQIGTLNKTEQKHRVEVMRRHAEAAKRPAPARDDEAAAAEMAADQVHQLAAQLAVQTAGLSTAFPSRGVAGSRTGAGGPSSRT